MGLLGVPHDGAWSMELGDEIRQLGGSQIILDTGCYLNKLGLYLIGDGEFQRVEDKSDILSFCFGFGHSDRGNAKRIVR